MGSVVRIQWGRVLAELLAIALIGGAGLCWAQPLTTEQGQRIVRVTTVLRPTAGQTPELTLRVYNYARVDPVSLASSEHVAAAIFAAAGVETAWVDCPLSQEEYAARPACQTNARPTDIDLKILPRRMAEKLRMRDDPAGFARPCSDSQPGCEVTVFYDLVDELRSYGYRTDSILGHVIAHEMAHVLIGRAHSEHGIMRGQWSHRELQRMSWGLLLCFSDGQAEALRAAVVRRATWR